jgi:hypothetical protein
VAGTGGVAGSVTGTGGVAGPGGAAGTGASPWPGRAGKTVKGMFVALALVVALEREPEPLPTLLALIGAVLAFLAGELYEAVMEARLRHRRALLATEFREIAYEQSFIAAGALPSILIFSCAAAGLLSTAAADNVAVWAGVALLAALGAAAGRLAREPLARCVLYGLESGAIGALIVALKVAVKKL